MALAAMVIEHQLRSPTVPYAVMIVLLVIHWSVVDAPVTMVGHILDSLESLDMLDDFHFFLMRYSHDGPPNLYEPVLLDPSNLE